MGNAEKYSSASRLDERLSSGNAGDLYQKAYVEPDEVPKVVPTPKREFVWKNIIILTFVHVSAVYGLYLAIFKAKWQTVLFHYSFCQLSGLGITAGAHRLWAHRTYSAKLPLRILLLTFNCIASQEAVIDWVRDHRMHHKHSETDADPHNATRGFFFAHVGWLFVRKHPAIKAKAHTIDIDDVRNDPLLRFQKRHFRTLALSSLAILTVTPHLLWGESITNSFFLRMWMYAASLNYTWLVNSAAHIWGRRPYDGNINPSDNPLVSLVAQGEGFHNYHHTFPWDYATAELGGCEANLAKLFVDTMAAIGWATDRKKPSPELVEQRVKRTGDGSSPHDPLWMRFLYGLWSLHYIVILTYTFYIVLRSLLPISFKLISLISSLLL